MIGAGPAGFFTTEALLRSPDVTCTVDLFDRLPTPYGLVRDGVAPDHQSIKKVTGKFEEIAADPRVRFFGNVSLETDVSCDDVRRHYHQVVYAVGARSDRHLGIPGEDLPGSHPATDFVAWYNGHPDFADHPFDLDHVCAVVIGNGNVAVDVARILVTDPDELATTDIADHALEVLRGSGIREVMMLGRRGPAQAKFTSVELKELGRLGCGSCRLPSSFSPGTDGLPGYGSSETVSYRGRTGSFEARERERMRSWRPASCSVRSATAESRFGACRSIRIVP